MIDANELSGWLQKNKWDYIDVYITRVWRPGHNPYDDDDGDYDVDFHTLQLANDILKLLKEDK